MSELKNRRLASSLGKTISNFIAKETNGRSMITITTVEILSRGKEAKIGVSVFPEEHETEAMFFLTRQAKHMRDEISRDIKSFAIPHLSFHIDKGYKNSIKVQELL